MLNIIFELNSENTYSREYVYVKIFLCFYVTNSFLKFFQAFSIHFVHSNQVPVMHKSEELTLEPAFHV
jgi:hypothetical protein